MGDVLDDKLVTVRKFPSGFTLIELLIVIGIVGLLAVLAVGSFGSANRRARLDVAVDSVMSLIKQQQGKAQTGRQGTAASGLSQNFCYGIFFQKTKPFVQTVEVPYVAVPPTLQNSPYADYCDTQNGVATLRYTTAEVANDVLVQDIGEAGSNLASLAVLFKPPFGAVYQGSAVDHIAPDAQVDTKQVRIFLNQSGNQNHDAKGIQFDPISGMVKRF